MSSHNKELTINVLPTNKQDVSLQAVKTALKRALMDFEEAKRELIPEFDIYDYIHSNLNDGFAESTLRKWCNPFEKHFCDPVQLGLICNLIGNNRPAVLCAEYLMAITNHNKKG